MINTKRVLLILCFILIPSAAIVSSIYLIKKNNEEVKGVNIQETGCKPYISNVIPNIAYVGKEYYFVPNIVGCNIEEVEIAISGVAWIELMDRRYLYGIPTISDIGDHKLEITIYGRSNVYNLVDYIIVKEDEK